ncbi:MAG TPA: hypothetical protein VGE74_12075 [Gemmata sp.]
MRVRFEMAILLVGAAGSSSPSHDGGPAAPAEQRAKARELARPIVPPDGAAADLKWARFNSRPAPTELTSADELAAAAPNAPDEWKGRFDFAKEKLVVFAWSARGRESIGVARVEVKDKVTTIVFTRTRYERPGRDETRKHLFLYAVPKDAEVKVEATTFNLK